MTDTLQPRGSNTGWALMGFALGALIGGGLALLMAPASGDKTRERIAAAARRWNKTARDTFDQVRETAGDLGADARAAVEAGRQAFKLDPQNSGTTRPAPPPALKG